MSNTPGQQHHNPQLKPTPSAGNPYSASPNQLTLPTGASPFQNPYQQQYTYGPTAHQVDPNQFAYSGQAHYPHHLQTQHQAVLQQQAAQQSVAGQSPTSTRKRRASELGGESALSASSSSTFSNQPTGLMIGGLDVGQGDLTNQQSQLPSPIVKKGRTNTPWTPAEEQRLKALRDAGSSWSEIAKTFPTRTEGSVKKHWYKDMHYAEFGEDEVSAFSAALLQAIKDYENSKWKVIGQKVGKPAKACEQFAKERGWKV
ncbi:hypothetical protein BAUCODRAFT_30306 [Baudoinia panamericana UAMH 10762]|uniref:Uncharacterized protein n=1 Tax=Baudoinia panamericana (strain UAMH 10762) TaxID=717646 RepID=M2NKC4_BAUPA|nr:uncharacterized protein BAUCODRAFT_30306 [Baudoinia panamericana UAMH 10762]EMC99889.1 hypothetical protein BAUCODRAFT_30306 [Baudoinia panamericana UAMH 10762]